MLGLLVSSVVGASPVDMSGIEQIAVYLPAGTVTFLLTDVEGSTFLWESAPEAMSRAIRRHYQLLDTMIARHGGARPVEQGEGDSVVAVFARAWDALATALDIQLSFYRERWPEGASLKVRIALHTAQAQLRDEANYFGPAVNRCARLRTIAHGGQVVLSETTRDLVADRLPHGADLIDLGIHRLSSLSRPEHLYGLLHPDLPAEFRPADDDPGVDSASPDVNWPLVGRADQLKQASTLLRAGHGAIVLAGAAGVGKTRLATECLDLASTRGFVPLRVSATSGAAELPFGAFASLVPDLTLSADMLEVLRTITEAIVGRGRGKPVAILVDDAHLLDQSSAALVHLLATNPQTFVLATLRSSEQAPDAVVALWKDGLAERIELHPFVVNDVEELLSGALRGPVDGATVHLLHRRTQGNVLFLRELVLGALEAGALRREEGIWRLSGTLPASSRLREIIETRLSGLDEPGRRALEALALGEPLEVDLLQIVETDIDLEALERRGLVRIEQDGRRLTARLAHPLYGEVLRARLSLLRSRAVARALADALTAVGARRRQDTLRLAVWSLEGGGSLQPDLMYSAASTARQRYDFPLAERLARAAVRAGAGFEASLLLAQTCWLQGRAEEAEQQLGALAAAATTDPQRGLLATTRIGVLDWALKQMDAALRVAEEAEAAIKDASCRDQITAERARILGRSGRHSEAITLAVPLLERVSGRALVSACFAVGTSMCITGQAAGAMAAAERGLAAHLQLTGPPLPFGPYLHQVIRCHALLHVGYLAKAGALADLEYDKAVEEGSVEARSFFAWLRGWVALNEGRVAAAARLSGEAAGAFGELRWLLWMRNSLANRAHALALLADVHTAHAVLAELDALGVPPLEICGSEVPRARAWTEVAGGDVAQGCRYLHEAAEMAQRSGAYALESSAVHDLARLGHAAVALPRLRKLAEVVEGPLMPARVTHAAALVCEDAAGLEASSAQFVECGAVLLAAEAAADAAVAWRRQGHLRRATGAERHANALAARCENPRTPALTTAVPTRTALTPRELQIARLAAAGLANKEIATRLCLSHRTVENKLHAAYHKLGVVGRAELARTLEAP
jgi:class 3 adenylate cyclase/DNA-binding CsgD family transcriptional regulator